MRAVRIFNALLNDWKLEFADGHHGANTGIQRMGFNVQTTEGGPPQGVPGESLPLEFLKLRSLEIGFPAF